MNQEIEYAEMLEIPVSTVNVEKKKRRPRRNVKELFARATEEREPVQAQTPDLKDSVIAQVNDRVLGGEDGDRISADAALFAEGANSNGDVDFGTNVYGDASSAQADGYERIDTVRLYDPPRDTKRRRKLFSRERAWENDAFSAQETGSENENGHTVYEMKTETPRERRTRIVLGAEFAAACVLCGAIFLTNVFMPGSAINTFFRTLENGTTNSQTDNRAYTDFTLSGVVSDFSDVELSLSPTGILTFQDECCVYPAADGTVSEVVKNASGTYTLKISHSDTFTGVIEGLNCVYYEVGDEVKANVPVGFTNGESEVQVTMYSEGELLNCFQITEENCLAWVEKK